MAYEITLHLKITPFKIQVLYQPLQLSSMSWHVLSQLFCNHLKSVFRCMVILTALVFLLIWRMWLMGSGPPKFQPSDNPASFSDSLLTKVSIFSYMKQINTIILPPPPPPPPQKTGVDLQLFILVKCMAFTEPFVAVL